MKRGHWITAGIGLALLLLAVWQLAGAARGLEITRTRANGLPLTHIALAKGAADAHPLVLIGHGFAGSTVLMRGFGLALAHAGYEVVLWDFDGHSANPQPAPIDGPEDGLLHNAEVAWVEAQRHGWGDGGRVAILGHSMGSGVALRFGQVHPETAATIAVSPVSQPVTPELPRNLLLLAGSLEAPFVRNAEERLAEAGGPGGDPAVGTARKLVVIPGVEHISILFAPSAHAAAHDWLDATFGPQPGAMEYTDRRMLWYGLGLLGILLLAGALAPLLTGGEPDAATTSQTAKPLWRRLGALAGGILVATLVLWLVSLTGLDLGNLLGLAVGGYLLLWFGLAGLFSLLLLWQRWLPPSWRALAGGLLAFAALWLGVGLLGQLVWLQWLLIPRRLVLWPLGALLLLSWFLAAGQTVEGASPAGRAAWWLAHSALLASAQFLALQLIPSLHFLILVLPLFPIILGLHALAAAPYRGRWPFALSGALFVSWLLLAVFPLA